jgi:phenylacetate-CoA ligase
MSFKNILIEKIVLSLSDILTGQSVGSKLFFLQKSQFWSKDQLEAYQNNKLHALIKHAFSSVPYYRDLMNRLGLKPNDIRQISDLKKLPILTKSVIQSEGVERFTSEKISAKYILPQSSSGSTGEPLFYNTTKEAYSMNIAANLRGWYWMGYRLGNRFIKLSQNPRNSRIKQLQDVFSNSNYLTISPLTDQNFDKILQEIEEYRPSVIRCYPDPLLMLARHKFKTQKFNYKPTAIATTGNTLFPEVRKEIEEIFGCKIFDSYNCEGNAMVFECPTHTGYHSAMEYGISEIINDHGTIISSGIGRLVSTDLWNLSHPFIRYDTQDLVEIDSEQCPCGRSHIKFKRILGRNNDIIETPLNRFIVHNFTIFFSRKDFPTFGTIDKFQVRKVKDKIIFYLVANQRFTSLIEKFIIEYWEKESGLNVEIKLVEHISLTKTGKHKFVINE